MTTRPRSTRTMMNRPGLLANQRLHTDGRRSLLRKPFICAPAQIIARLNIAPPARHVARG